MKTKIEDRKSSIRMAVILWAMLAAMILLCEICRAETSIHKINHHDHNIPCRQIKPVGYETHPLYGQDCNDLALIIEQATGQPWILTYAQYWMDCHPYSDPVERCDVNFDGVTDLRDFKILASCKIVYVTPTGAKYHADRHCRYLTDKNRKPILLKEIGNRTPCAVCIIAQLFLKDN